MRSRFYFRVFNADNLLVATLNDSEIYRKETQGDPSFNESKEITDLIQPGITNLLNVKGWNYGSSAQGWENPYHFYYQILRVNGADTYVIGANHIHGPEVPTGDYTGPYLRMDKTHTIALVNKRNENKYYIVIDEKDEFKINIETELEPVTAL